MRVVAATAISFFEDVQLCKELALPRIVIVQKSKKINERRKYYMIYSAEKGLYTIRKNGDKMGKT